MLRFIPMKSSSLRAVSAVLMTVLFIGAGCNPMAPSAPTTPTPTPNTPSTPTPAQPSADAAALTPQTKPDDTWLTYTNNELKFAFDYPTKGRYAPEWESTILAADTSDIRNGCFTPTGGERHYFTLNNVSICQTAAGFVKAGTQKLSRDHFVIKKDNHYIVIAFAKSYPADQATFDENEYQKQLQTIISTYRDQ
jgi:hypothetical protein